MPDAPNYSPALAGPGFYLHPDDNLRITVYNALATVRVKATGRRLDAISGRVEPFEHEFTPTSDRVASIITRRLGEGWLLNLQLFASNAAPLHGQAFAVASIVRGQEGFVVDLATLAAGYVTAKQRVAWPGGIITSSLEGHGALRSIAGSTPAAGAEISETVPTGARWELLAFEATFVTSAVAANRVPQLTIDDGTTVVFRLGAALNQAASLTQRRSWFQGAPAPYLDNASNLPLPIPSNVRLGSGFRIKTVTAAIDVGDQYSAVQYLVREWIEGA
jgi:hypothetical protein